MTVTWPLRGDADYSDVVRGSIDDALQNLQDQINALPSTTGAGALLAINNLTDVPDPSIARTYLDVFSKSEIDAQIAARISESAPNLDAGLLALQGLTPAANKGIYYTGTTTSNTFDLTPFARTVLDDVDVTAMQATLFLTPGTNVQAFNGNLFTIGNIIATNDDIIQRKAGAWTNRTPAQFKVDLNLTKSDVGLGNVDNTSDLSKPVPTAVTTALAGKLSIASNLSELTATAATARSNLGLGTIATLTSTGAGDLSGTWPTITVAKVNGVTITGTPTSGQTMVATSGTAASWQTPPTGNIPVAQDVIWDVKGDLAVGSGANTAIVLTAGANDTMLVADSAAASGLKWAIPSVVRTALGLGTAALLSSTVGGDLTGTLPNPTVARINGVAVSGTPTAGQTPTATSGTTATWQAQRSVAIDPIFDALGDLAVGTGADTSAKLTVGATDTMLVADPLAATGMKWATPVVVRNALGLGSMSLLTSAASLDLSGTWPTITVAKVNGVAVTGVPAAGQVIVATGTTAATWQPTPSPNVPVASDVIWNSKGDLAAGTGADTAIALGVGANDTMLMADSSRTNGLKWGSADVVKFALALNLVDNTSDANKPVSTAQATADNLRILLTQKGAVGGVAPLDGAGLIADTFIPPGITRDTELTTAINNLINAAPGTLDTLNEIAIALGNDPDFVGTMTGLINARVPNTLYDANTVLAANVDNTPLALTLPVQTLLGRITGGNIAALTPVQVQTMLGLVPGTNVQGFDADLTTIGNIAPANDDVIQRKAGAWTNRTMAQVKADLVLTQADVGLANVTNTSDVNKPVSTLQQAALDLKANITNPTFITAATAPLFKADGTFNGMTQPTRLVGAIAAGLPLAGAFAVGDLITRNGGAGLLLCTVAGTVGVGAGPTFVGIPDSLTTALAITAQINALPEIAFSDPSIMSADTPVGSAVTTVDVSNVQPMALRAAIGIGQNGGGVATPDAFGNTIVANNSAVFSDVLVLPVAAASTYEVLVRCIYIVDAAADMKMQFLCTGNATLEWGVIGAGPGVAAATITGIGIPRRSRRIFDAEIVGGIGTYANPAPVVAVATTANVALTGEQTIDGVLTAGSRILVKNQTATAQNGIYVTAAGAWARAVDMDVAAEFTTNALVTVTGGTVNAGTSWQQQNVITTVGTDGVTFGAPGMIVEVRGTLTTDVGGNFRFRAAQQTAAVNNLWVISGSSMMLRKVA